MKPGVKTIIAGAVLFLIGAVVVPLSIALPLILGTPKAAQFIIPGTMATKIEKPGRYYLWNDFQTMYDGKSYNRSESIPDGLEIHVRDSKGEPINFVSDTSITMSNGGASRHSIGYVELASPGKVSIEVSGGNEERVFSFAQSGLLKMFVRIVGGVGIALVFGFAGFGIIIWGIVKLVRGRKTGGQRA